MFFFKLYEQVYPWANGCVLWNTATVNSCLDWIRDLETKTGTNTLDALLTAFHDERTHAVCLVTGKHTNTYSSVSILNCLENSKFI